MPSIDTQFKKGSGGRPKGSVSKVNADVRTMLKAFTESGYSRFIKSLAKMNEKDFCIFYLKTVELILPKRVEADVAVTNEPAIDYSKLTDEELHNLQGLLKKGIVNEINYAPILADEPKETPLLEEVEPLTETEIVEPTPVMQIQYKRTTVSELIAAK